MNLKILALAFCTLSSTFMFLSCRKNKCGEPTADQNVEQDSIALNIYFYHSPPNEGFPFYQEFPFAGGRLEAEFTEGRFYIYGANNGNSSLNTYVDMNDAVYYNGSALPEISNGSVYGRTFLDQQGLMTIEWVDANCRRFSNSFSYDSVQITNNFDTIPRNSPFSYSWIGAPAKEGEVFEIWLYKYDVNTMPMDISAMYVSQDTLTAGDTSGVFDFSSYTALQAGPGAFRIVRRLKMPLQDSTSAGGSIVVEYRSGNTNVVID